MLFMLNVANGVKDKTEAANEQKVGFILIDSEKIN